MQFGGTTKYVALKICVATGHSSKLAMLRKLPEITNSDLPWCHGSCHGAMVKPMVGIVLPVVPHDPIIKVPAFSAHSQPHKSRVDKAP